MISPMGVPIGNSHNPGFLTRPLTPNIFVPESLNRPKDLNQSAPKFKICGKLQKVSTLFTMVGLPHKPATCGNGGFALGVARLPSRELIKAVSSPQI